MGKKLDSLNTNKQTFEEYFKEDLEAIDIELQKSEEYSKIIDEEINKLVGPTLGSNKGVQHYLIEHITNAVQLQTQRQGLRKDRFAIKKAILDYATKMTDPESSESNSKELMALMNEILEKDRAAKVSQEEPKKPQSTADLDSEIDSILGEGK